MDGTLVDSEKLWDVALQELAARVGGTLSAAGPARDDRHQHGRVDAHPARRPRPARTGPGRPAPSGSTPGSLELFADGLRLAAGRVELLRAVRAAGLPTALVTSTGRPLVEVALDTLGRDNFDARGLRRRGRIAAKPRPGAVPDRRPAAGRADRAGCVAIEDSPTGVASALAVGRGGAGRTGGAGAAADRRRTPGGEPDRRGPGAARGAADRSGRGDRLTRPARVGGARLPTGRVQWRSAKTAGPPGSCRMPAPHPRTRPGG